MSWSLTKVAVSALFAVALTATASAQSYPSQNIRIIVPFAGGSPSDIMARLLADHLKADLKATVYVENKPGAAGRVAMSDLLSRPRDGHTLHLCSHLAANNTVVMKNPGYKLEDIVPVALLARAYFVFAVSNSVPSNSPQEFLKYAKSRPEGLSYGRVGPGGIAEFVIRELELIGGFKSVAVPFKGTNEAVLEMTAGRIDFVVGPYNMTMPLHETKKIKVLAVTSPERLPVAKEIPTFVEQQIPITTFGWYGVCAGAGVPQPIIDVLNKHISDATNSKAYAQLMEENGLTTSASSPEALGAIMKDSVSSTTRLMQVLGMPQID